MPQQMDSQIRTVAEGANLRTDPIDRELVAEFKAMCELIGHRVRTVAHGHQVGAYITGRPGAGKTETVVRTLDELGADYVLANARMSPAALFDLIEERPNSVIVLDDIPSLFDNPQSVQILLAICGGRAGLPRQVSYSIKGVRRTVMYTGGIIAISNLPLGHKLHDVALASRLSTLQHEPTDDMLASFLREVARGGYREIPPGECADVVEFILAECKAGDYRLDLRYYFKGIEDYSYATATLTPEVWQDLIRSTMRKLIPDSGDRTQAGRNLRHQELALELHNRNLPRNEREAEWFRLTGKKKDTYYRAIERLRAVGRLT